MMNWIWLGLIVLSILVGAFTGQMQAVTLESFSAAKDAVWLALNLVGIMAFWLGIMKVAEHAGLLRVLARWLRRPMRWLFPDVPEDHPAMSAMILNFGANMLGLANAATPFGILAMVELNKLNRHKGTATNAMCLFLAINTSSLTLLATGTVGLRAAAGSQDPAAIWLPGLASSIIATIVGISSAKLLQRMKRFAIAEQELAHPQQQEDESMDGQLPSQAGVDTPALAEPEKAGIWVRLFVWSCVLVFVVAVGLYYGQWALEASSLKEVLSSWTQADPMPQHVFVTAQGAMSHVAEFYSALPASVDMHKILDDLLGFGLWSAVMDFFSFWAIPALMGGLLLAGLARGVKVYESVVDGAKQGFSVAIKIIPYLVAVLVAVAMFKASGAMDILKATLGQLTEAVGMPAEAIPMAVIRPLSGNGAFAYMNSIFSLYGPDSFIGLMVSVMQQSTETTLYVLAVYFGAVQVYRVRHALAAGLLADLAGIIAAVVMCHVFF